MDGLINLLTFYYGWMMDGSVDLLLSHSLMFVSRNEWFVYRSAY